MKDHIIINIAHSGHHWARVQIDHYPADAAADKFREFQARFPASEGWQLKMTLWTCVGKEVEVN